jgi:hypothetical protein
VVQVVRMVSRFIIVLALWPRLACGADRLNILDFVPNGLPLDRNAIVDASPPLALAILAANEKTSKGEPACVYIPAGTYRITSPPPSFARAGCIVGDGPSQSILTIAPMFYGDLFSWSEAWIVTTPGPTVAGLSIHGTRSTQMIQNALVFYDRNDQVFIDNVDIMNLHGRALYSGITKNSDRAYMRESHMRSLRFFGDGAPEVPVVEFNSQGVGVTDATNEIRISQMDIYAAHGPSFVIRNNSSGAVRNIIIDALRIEGEENGTTLADLLVIGDPIMRGNVNNIMISNTELIDPYRGYAALRLIAPPNVAAPYQITVQAMIGGGSPAGQGLRIDAGRTSSFRFSGIHTNGTNVVIGPHVTGIVLDGGGQEASWSYEIDPTSTAALRTPALNSLRPR